MKLQCNIQKVGVNVFILLRLTYCPERLKIMYTIYEIWKTCFWVIFHSIWRFLNHVPNDNSTISNFPTIPIALFGCYRYDLFLERQGLPRRTSTSLWIQLPAFLIQFQLNMSIEHQFWVERDGEYIITWK